MPIPVIELIGLTKTYGSSRGVTDINLNVDKGEIFGFLGPNGAGKTTTIRMIMDFIRPTAGSIKVLGLDSHDDYTEIHQKVGYLTGDMEMDPKLTGQQFLEYLGSLHGGFHKKRVSELAARLQCDLGRKLKHLSRGNRQKVGLIAALMQDPEILILDEPTSGLDPLIQAQFNEILREHAAKGKTAFVSSHILSEVQNICDRVAFIREGRIVRVSPLSELLNESYKRVQAIFKNAAEAKNFTILGAEELAVKSRAVSFNYKGDVNKLVAGLSRYKLDNLTIQHVELEDLFMQYYAREDKDVE